MRVAIDDLNLLASHSAASRGILIVLEKPLPVLNFAFAAGLWLPFSHSESVVTMKGYFSRGLVISMVAPAAYAQATRAIASLSAAAATVTTSPSAAPPLFPYEAVQLTESALARADTALNNATLSRLFAFGASNSTNSSGTPQHRCKVMPGDATWPTESTWGVFDQLLGGSLLKPAPLAASCYPNWPEYNTEQCSEITSNWLDNSLQ